MPKLTKRVVDQAAANATGDHLLWDNEIRGFGIRIRSSGRHTYVVQYRNAYQRSRRMTLGQHGRLTPDQARKEARRVLAEVDCGLDPVQERQRRQDNLSMDILAERYLEDHAIPKKKPSSVRTDRQLLRTHILPAFGNRLITEIDRVEVTQLHLRIGRRTPGAANRALALMSKMFNLAERWGLRPDGTNPCRHVERFPEGKRERFLTSKELGRLGAVLSTSEEPPEAIAAIRLFLFTGCRSGEILPLEWSNVDFEHRCLRLSDSKTGAKVVPLGTPALELLASLPRIPGNPYVLTGRFGRGHLVGLRHIWQRIREEACIPDVRIHDLRHSFASVGASGGLGLPVIGKLLGHRSPATTARYSHLADDPVKKAADQIAGQIAERLSGIR